MADSFVAELSRNSRGLAECRKDALKHLAHLALNHKRHPDVCRAIVDALCRQMDRSDSGPERVGLACLADWLARSSSETYRPLLAPLAPRLFSGAMSHADSQGRARLDKVRRSWRDIFHRQPGVAAELDRIAGIDSAGAGAGISGGSILGLDVDADIIQFALGKQQAAALPRAEKRQQQQLDTPYDPFVEELQKEQRQQQQQQSQQQQPKSHRQPPQLTEAEAAQLLMFNSDEDYRGGGPPGISQADKRSLLAFIHDQQVPLFSNHKERDSLTPPPVFVPTRTLTSESPTKQPPQPVQDVDMRVPPRSMPSVPTIIPPELKQEDASAPPDSRHRGADETIDASAASALLAPKRPRFDDQLPANPEPPQLKQDVDMRRQFAPATAALHRQPPPHQLQPQNPPPRQHQLPDMPLEARNPPLEALNPPSEARNQQKASRNPPRDSQHVLRNPPNNNWKPLHGSRNRPHDSWNPSNDSGNQPNDSRNWLNDARNLPSDARNPSHGFRKPPHDSRNPPLEAWNPPFESRNQPHQNQPHADRNPSFQARNPPLQARNLPLQKQSSEARNPPQAVQNQPEPVPPAQLSPLQPRLRIQIGWHVNVPGFPGFPQVGFDPRLLRKTFHSKKYIEPSVCCHSWLLEGLYRPLFTNRLQPCTVVEEVLHGVRYTGPPVTLLVDGQRFSVPTSGLVRLQLQSGRLAAEQKQKAGTDSTSSGPFYTVCLGGPMHELCIDGRALHIQFGGSPVFKSFGRRHCETCAEIQLLGPEPPVALLPAVPDQLINWADDQRFGPFRSEQLVDLPRCPVPHDRRRMVWTYKEYPDRLKPLIADRLAKIDKKNRQLGLLPPLKEEEKPPVAAAPSKQQQQQQSGLTLSGEVSGSNPSHLASLFDKLVETGLISASQASAETADHQQQQQQPESRSEDAPVKFEPNQPDDEDEEGPKSPPPSPRSPVSSPEPAEPEPEPWERRFADYDIWLWRARNPYVLEALYGPPEQCGICGLRYPDPASLGRHSAACLSRYRRQSTLYRRWRGWMPPAAHTVLRAPPPSPP